MGAGHASTSIGYAVGLKEAMRKGIGEDGKVVAVIGDGALTGGVAYEALHAAGGLQTPIVIVLNDNGMSISPNVGALSRYFNRVRLNPRLYHAREGVEDRLTKLPLGLGKRIERLGPEIKSAIKAYWAPGLFFEELDLAYVGVIDGHDVARPARGAARGLRRRPAGRRPHPHRQGQGLRPGRGGRPRGDGEVARRQAEDRSSTAAPAAEAGRRSAGVRLARGDRAGAAREAARRRARRRSTPQVFADAIVAEAKRDQRVIGITAAMAGGTGLQKLADEVPEQYYDVGIAEQNAVLLASGLALQGAKPVCAIYSTFLQRAYDQIIHDVCLQELDVTFAMDRAGLVGDDGPTHHGAFDVSYFRPIPNVVVMAPRDEAMLVHMLRTAIAHDGPAALRYPRGAAEGVELPAEPRGDPDRHRRAAGEGERVALLGYGYGVQVALARGRDPRRPRPQPTVADARFAKPLDAELLERLALDHELVVTIEENVLPGGFGSAVLEHLEDAFAERAEERAARAARSAFPTATSPTASRRCCARRSASPARRSPSGCSPRCAPASPRSARRTADPCARPAARISRNWGLHQCAQSVSLLGVSSGVTRGRRGISMYVGPHVGSVVDLQRWPRQCHRHGGAVPARLVRSP